MKEFLKYLRYLKLLTFLFLKKLKSLYRQPKVGPQLHIIWRLRHDDLIFLFRCFPEKNIYL